MIASQHYLGPKLYNNIPINIKTKNKQSDFQEQIKDEGKRIYKTKQAGK